MYNNLLNQPLWQMTGADFLQLHRLALDEQMQGIQSTPPPTKRYVYGLRGICDLFQCSHAHAQKLKDGVLKPAIKQVGRKIIVDVDAAMALLDKK